MKPKFATLLPELLNPMQAALRSEGLPAQAQSLTDAEIERWTYDASVNAGYVYLVQGEMVAVGEIAAARTLVLMDEYSFNIDLRARGEVWGVELLNHAEIFERLGATRH